MQFLLYRKLTRKIHRKLVIRPGETKYVIQRNKHVFQCPKCGKPGKQRYVRHGPKGGGNVGRYYPCVVHYDPELYREQESAFKQGKRKSKGNGTVFHYYHWWYDRDMRYTKRPVDMFLADPSYWRRPEYTFPEEVQEAIKKGRAYNQLHRLEPLL